MTEPQRVAFAHTARPMSFSLFITVALAWGLLPIVAAFFPMLRVRMQRFSREPIDFADVRPHLVDLLLPECEALVRRGFELVSPVRVHDFEATARDARDGFHLVHREHRVHAYVRASPSPDRARPIMLVLESFLADGKRVVLLATRNARFTSSDLESKRCIEHFSLAEDVSSLLDAHLARRAKVKRDVVEVDDVSALERSAEAWNAGLDRAVTEGDWVPAAEPGWLRMTLGSALSYAVGKRVDVAWRRRTQESALRSASEGAAPVEEEVDALARLDEVLARPLVRAHSMTLLVFGTGAFVLWYGWESWQVGLALAGVVLIHEAGHGLAMHLAGYRDVRVYFIPFFGGATSGSNREASIHQESFVLLAGPLPGLALSVGVWALEALEVVPASPLVVQIIWLLFAVNYINLLPVFPLDGGRIAHRLVAGRLPVLEVLLRVVAAGVLGIAAMNGLGTALGLLAVFMVIGLPGAWRVARLERALRQRGADALVGDERTAAIFAALEGVRGWIPRVGLARQLSLRLAAPDASWLARFAWGAVYATCLLLPVPMIATVWMSLEEAEQTEQFSEAGEADEP